MDEIWNNFIHGTPREAVVIIVIAAVLFLTCLQGLVAVLRGKSW